MSVEYAGVIAIGIYLLLLFAVALLARRARRSDSPADHYLAGRGLGTFVLFFTLYATAYSGNTLIAYPGEAYRRGFLWLMSPGFMLAVILAFHLLVPKLRPIAERKGFVTPGDWVRERFGDEPGGRALRVAVAIVMTFALSNYLLAQLRAMGVVVGEATGGRVPYAAGVVGLAAMILFYETTGGMRAVAWTDAIQGLLMLVGLSCLFGWLLIEAGGLAEITTRVAELRPDAVAVPDWRGCANWASTVVLVGLGSTVYPQAVQRIFAAKSRESLRRALAVMGFMPLFTTGVVALLGIAAIARFSELGVMGADRVMPMLLRDWSAAGPLFAVIAVVVLVGALAAIMSTADSVILSLSSLVACDVLGRPRNDPDTTRLGKGLAIGIMAAMCLLALDARITLWSLLELKMEVLVQCVPAFLLALHWRRLSARAVLVGLVVGAAIVLLAWGFGVKRLGGVHVGVIGLAANTLICVIASVVGPLRRVSLARATAAAS